MGAFFVEMEVLFKLLFTVSSVFIDGSRLWGVLAFLFLQFSKFCKNDFMYSSVTYVAKNVSLPPFSVVVRRKYGWIQMRTQPSPLPIPGNLSASCIKTTWLFVSRLPYTRGLVLADTWLLADLVVTQDSVKGRVRPTLVCLKRCYGCGICVFCVVCLSGTELPTKLTSICKY